MLLSSVQKTWINNDDGDDDDGDDDDGDDDDDDDNDDDDDDDDGDDDHDDDGDDDDDDGDDDDENSGLRKQNYKGKESRKVSQLLTSPQRILCILGWVFVNEVPLFLPLLQPKCLF